MFGYTCTECGQGTVRKKTFTEYKTKIKGYPFVVRDAVVGICDACGAEHFAAEETKRWEKLFHESSVERGFFLSPEGIQQIRRSLNMSMADFAALIGCTRQSLYNWERRDRTRPQSRMADLMIRLVDESHRKAEIDVLRFLVQEAQKLGLTLKVLRRRMPVDADLTTNDELGKVPRVLVLGVGDGGCSTVNRMPRTREPSVTYVAINTDKRALRRLRVPIRILIGDKVTHGLGVGGDAALGRKAAQQSRGEIAQIVESSDMVLLIAAMGGGTGTGAAPEIGRICKELGVLTIGLVTRPFSFESAQRKRIARQGIAELATCLDTLICVPCDGILEEAGDEFDAASSFATIEHILELGVSAIVDVGARSGLINLDLADAKAILTGAGLASMSVGTGRGRNRATKAARAATTSPMLENAIREAKGIFFSISGGNDLTLFEVNEAAQVIHRAVDPNANIIFAVYFDPQLESEVRIALIATTSTMDESRTIKADAADRILAQVFGDEALDESVDLPAFLRRYWSQKESDSH